MNFIIFFIYVSFVSSELHSFITTYTGITGQNESQRIPEFVAVSSLDDHQIDYYDSNTVKLIPKQNWMKEFASKEAWTEDTDIRKHVQHIYKLNIHELMERFNQTEDPPKVSLLQKSPEYYVACHVTGFLFRNTSILWRKNGRDINSSSKLVKSKVTLPNEDGTFQRTVTLSLLPDQWKNDQYTCVVEHQSLTEPIQKILTVNETESNTNKPDPRSDVSYVMHPASLAIIIVIAVLCVLYGLYVLWENRMALRIRNKRTYKYFKNQRLHRGHAEPLNPRISTVKPENPQ